MSSGDASALRRRVLLSGTMLVAAVAGYGRRAYAACVNAGGSTYQCSGTETTTQTISANSAAVSTVAGFSVNTATGNGIMISGDGALSYTDTNSAQITAAYAALYVKSTGDFGGTPGSVTINTNGALTGGAYGIYTRNSAGTDLSVTTGPGTVSGGNEGIYAHNFGTGVVTITANGNVTGTSGHGIFAYNSAAGTGLNVTTAAGTTVSGGYGIRARNFGSGALTITANGNVTGTNGIGIFAENFAGTNLSVTTAASTTASGDTGIIARNYGSGVLTITANGNVTGTAQNGIYAKNSAAGAALSVTTAAGTTVTGATYGIFARKDGSGALTITANGNVTGSTMVGINARNSAAGTDLSVTTAAGATVTGGRIGIFAGNNGTGALTVTANGNVIGNYGNGIVANNSAAGTDLNVTTGAGTTVSGTSQGINATNSGTGVLAITANGNVTGTAQNGIYAKNSAAGTDLSVTTGAGTTVSGANRGIVAGNSGTGALSITANGNVTATTGYGIGADNTSTGTSLSVTTTAGTTVSGTSGISAYNRGTGALTVTANGDVTGTNNYGISVRNTGTDLTVTTGATVSGTSGILAYNRGTGALTVTANGNVTATTGSSIYALNNNTGTSLSVTTGAGTTARGTSYGIQARNNGTGALTVTANGDVTSTSGRGILARNSSTGTDLSVTTGAGTTVTGATTGILARNYGTGALIITTNGNVSSSHSGIYARSSVGAIAITVGATSTVTSTGTGAGDFAIKTLGGPATVMVAGTVAGAMSIAGTLTFQSTGIYRIAVTPATATLSTVSGAATLGGATVNAVFANGSYIAKQYTILTAGGIGGTFGAITNTNLPANFHDTLSYDATHAYLDLTLNFTTPAAGTINGNQNNVANALTNYFNTTGGIPLVFGALNANGLSQASGQPGASTSQTGIGATGQFVSAVFDGAFGGDAGQGGAMGFAQEDEANAYAAKRKMSREAKDAYAAVTPRDRAAPSFASRWNVWASVYGGNSRVNGDASAGTSTTNSRMFGTAVGASYRFTPDTQAGFALGGAGSSFSLDGGFGSGKADVFNAAIYGKHTFGAVYVAGLLGYSWQDTTTDRTVTISGTDKLHASFKAQALTARLEGGWRYATPMLGITPYAALQTTAFYLPSYGETATSGSNTFALSYASKTVTATRGELGAKFDKAMPVQNGVFTLKAKTAWAHDWNTDRSATATFQTLPGATFATNGAQPSANAALLSLGGEMGWHNGWSLAASFDGEFSRTTAGYAGKGSVKYAW